MEDDRIGYQKIIDLLNNVDDAIDYKHFSKQYLASINSATKEVKKMKRVKSLNYMEDKELFNKSSSTLVISIRYTKC